MKQTKQVKKEKDNFLKMTFLLPVVTSVIDAVIVAAAVAVYSANPDSITNLPMARLLVQVATILLTMSPPILLLTASLSLKHVKKYPDGSSFYKKTPMLLSMLVWGAQTLYMVTLM